MARFVRSADIDISSSLTPPVSTSLVWATWALFVGLFLMLMGGGIIATLIGVRAAGSTSRSR